MAHIHISATRGATIDDFRADEDGLHVVTVWQSKAHQERWAAEQLFPAFQTLGMTDVVSNSKFTEYDADELYIR